MIKLTITPLLLTLLTLNAGLAQQPKPLMPSIHVSGYKDAQYKNQRDAESRKALHDYVHRIVIQTLSKDRSIELTDDISHLRISFTVDPFMITKGSRGYCAGVGTIRRRGRDLEFDIITHTSTSLDDLAKQISKGIVSSIFPERK